MRRHLPPAPGCAYDVRGVSVCYCLRASRAAADDEAQRDVKRVEAVAQYVHRGGHADMVYQLHAYSRYEHRSCAVAVIEASRCGVIEAHADAQAGKRVDLASLAEVVVAYGCGVYYAVALRLI